MNEREGIILRFECCLETPFHSTEKRYKNLLKSAPYILGSALRGELLGNMIIKYCAEEEIRSLSSLKEEAKVIEYHSKCELSCLIKELLWNNKWGIFVSFGEFENPEYRPITRIALNRDSRTSSEGSIVNLEQIEAGCNFSFEIVLHNDKKMVGEVKLLFENIGRYFGIGRYKNVGMGRFSIKDIAVKKVKDIMNEKIAEFRAYGKKNRLTFTTPFLLHHNGAPLDLDQNQFASLFSQMLSNRSKELSEFLNLDLDIKPIPIDFIRTYIIPDYVSRYSLEESMKKNRLVAKVGSSFELYLSKENDSLHTQLILCSMFGVGEWADVGFGRFSVETG
jgi:CRISPR/Cas system CSM-associated protein Csm3 (group 7 of RAMP superfamily)